MQIALFQRVYAQFDASRRGKETPNRSPDKNEGIHRSGAGGGAEYLRCAPASELRKGKELEKNAKVLGGMEKS